MSQINTKHKKEKAREWPNTRPETADADDTAPNGTDYIGKSFSDLIIEDEVLMDGAREFPVLKAVIKSLNELFVEREESMRKSIDEHASMEDDFSKSLGSSLGDTGRAFHELDQRIQTLEFAGPEPVPAPEQVPGLNKSMFGDFAPSRDQVLDTLIKGVQSGNVPAKDVTLYELSNQMSPASEAFIKKSLGG